MLIALITILKYLLSIIGLIGVLALPGSIIFIIIQLIRRQPVGPGLIALATSPAILIFTFIVYAIIFTIERNFIFTPNAII